MAWAPDYITVSELRSYLRITDTDDDVQLADAIAAASRAIDLHCGRQFGLVDAVEERFYTARWDRRRCRWIIPIDDLMISTGLVVANVDGDPITDYRLEPRNNVAKGRPWEYITVGTDSAVTPSTDRDGISGIGRWGWTSSPGGVRFACKVQSGRFHARRDSLFGVAGSPDTGSELRLLAKVDPDLQVSLSNFCREWFAA